MDFEGVTMTENQRRQVEEVLKRPVTMAEAIRIREKLRRKLNRKPKTLVWATHFINTRHIHN
jgi:hypothetical protein